MAELKTRKNNEDIELFISKVANETRRADASALLELMREVTLDQGAMWGASIIGFGSYEYTYASGHSGVWAAVGFSPRKQNTVVYIMPGSSDMKSCWRSSASTRLASHVCTSTNSLISIWMCYSN
jgi:hypothetical protein